MTRYIKTGRQAYKAIMANTFLNEKTGAFEQINESPWFLKVRRGKPGYFLKMTDKFQQMPETCFHLFSSYRSKISKLQFKRR